MPELPEVETIRRDLAKRILGHKVRSVEIRNKQTVKNSAQDFIEKLIGNEIMGVERRGKLLAIKLKSGEYLLVHLKMTGQLIYRSGEKIIAGGHSLNKSEDNFSEKFTRVVIDFTGGARVWFNDMRIFGYMKIVSSEEKEKIFKNNFGIEPLTKDFTWNNFSKLFVKRKTNIKALLMNQKLISGLGNIYADEVCFCAGIMPTRKVDKISLEEQKKLFKCISLILKLAIKHRGTTFNSYVDFHGKKGSFVNFLKVYDRKGRKCVRCGNQIKKIRAAGRGTHYCPVCQR